MSPLEPSTRPFRIANLTPAMFKLPACPPATFTLPTRRLSTVTLVAPPSWLVKSIPFAVNPFTRAPEAVIVPACALAAPPEVVPFSERARISETCTPPTLAPAESTCPAFACPAATVNSITLALARNFSNELPNAAHGRARMKNVRKLCEINARCRLHVVSQIAPVVHHAHNARFGKRRAQNEVLNFSASLVDAPACV